MVLSEKDGHTLIGEDGGGGGVSFRKRRSSRESKANTVQSYISFLISLSCIFAFAHPKLEYKSSL